MLRVPLISACLVLALALPASAGAALPGGFVGMTSEDSFARGGSYREANLAAQRKAGVRLLRQTFDWSQIETSPGVYSWRVHDKLVLATARNGLAVLPILFNPPAWHSSRPASGARRGTYPPGNPAAMARFAAAAVGRYGPRGSLWRENPGAPARPVRAWQVWNEPSLPAYWGGSPNARAYVRLLKAVNGAIKRADRRAEIVTAGLPPSKLRGAVPILRYIRQVHRAGGKRYFDTLAVNSYARNARELGKLLTGVRRAMNRGRDRRARIWITELGWCDSGPRHRFCVGSARQARLTRTSIALIRRGRKRLRLRGFVYYTWRDATPYAPDFRDHWGLHTGLVRLNGRPKPALREFIRALRALR
jgi:hypothetical protein